jgi:putative transposase
MRAWSRPSHGLSSDEREELARLRRENQTLRMEREILKSRDILRQGDRRAVGELFSFVAAEKANHPVAVMPGARGQPHLVSRLGAPAAVAAGARGRLADREDEQVHAANRGVYGAPRIHAELRLAHRIRISRKRVERLMRTAGISGLAPRERERTTIRVQGVKVADDLVERRFRPPAPNLLWLADITYLRSWEGAST